MRFARFWGKKREIKNPNLFISELFWKKRGALKPEFTHFQACGGKKKKGVKNTNLPISEHFRGKEKVPKRRFNPFLNIFSGGIKPPKFTHFEPFEEK